MSKKKNDNQKKVKKLNKSSAKNIKAVDKNKNHKEKEVAQKQEKALIINDVECKPLVDFKVKKEAIKKIISIKTDDKSFLRIMIDIGGCAGMRYHMILDDYISENDMVYIHKKLPILVIDDYSFTYLKGGSIEFEVTLEGENFKINNPNTGGSCSCGSSFSSCSNQ